MTIRFSSSKFTGVIVAMILANGAGEALAGDIIAARNIRAGAVIRAEDLVAPADNASLRVAATYVGLEAARSIYKGQPLSVDDLRSPTIVDRNAIVAMEFVKGPLTITTEGRAMDPGAQGDSIRVMNLLSKRIVTATIVNPNTVRTKQ